MNKRKMIFISLVLVLILMGTAFAWWTQSTTIANTVNTGELEVKLEKFGDAGVYFSDPSNPYTDASGLNIKDYGAKASYTVSDDQHSLTFNAENLFPGSYATYAYKVINSGTVPVKINDITLIPGETNLSQDLLDSIKIYFDYMVVREGQSDPVSEGIVEGKYDNIASLIKEKMGDIVLLPGDRIIVGDQDFTNTDSYFNGFTVKIPQDWQADEGENSTLSFSVVFDYIQANSIK